MTDRPETETATGPSTAPSIRPGERLRRRQAEAPRAGLSAFARIERAAAPETTDPKVMALTRARRAPERGLDEAHRGPDRQDRQG